MFEKEIAMKTDKGKEMAINVVRALGLEIFEALDKDKALQLDWGAFKKFTTFDKQKRQDTMIFVQNHIQ